MPREYRHIKQYENEILRLKSEGLSKVFCIYLLLEICMTIAFNSKKSICYSRISTYCIKAIQK